MKPAANRLRTSTLSLVAVVALLLPISTGCLGLSTTPSGGSPTPDEAGFGRTAAPSAAAVPAAAESTPTLPATVSVPSPAPREETATRTPAPTVRLTPVPSPVPASTPVPPATRTIRASVALPPYSGALTASAFVSPDDAWLAVGGAILGSSDAGGTWERLSALDSAVRHLDFTTLDDGWAATAGGLFATSDGGRTWRKVATGGGDDVLRVDFASLQSGWALTTMSDAEDREALYRTSDGGQTWVALGNPCDSWGGKASFSFTNATNGWLTCAMTAGAGGEAKLLYRSDDAGSRWRLVSQSAFGSLDPAAPKSIPGSGYIRDVSFRDESSGWLATSRGGLLHTTDSGLTWRPLASFYDERFPLKVRFFSEERGYLLASSGGQEVLLGTRDSGNSWTQLYPAIAPTRLLAYPDSAHVFGIGESMGKSALLASTDGGRTWREAHSFASDGVLDLSFPDAQHGWALLASASGPSRRTLAGTSDGGTTWATLASWTDPAAAPELISMVDARVGYAVSGGRKIVETLDGGHSFAEVSASPSLLVDLDFASPTAGLTASNGTISATSDGGRTWTSSRLAYNIAKVDLVSPSRGWVVAADCRDGTCASLLFSTDDAGQSWTRYDLGGLPVSEVRFADAENGLLLDNTFRLYSTSDGGLTWAPVG